MKNITIIMSMVIGLMTLNSANAQSKNSMDQFEIQVDGLGCPFCAYGLEKKFKEFKGIKKVAIDIETGDFSFLYPAEKALEMQTVLKQVEKAGYTPNIAVITRADGSVETNAVVKDAMATSNLTTTDIYVYGKCGMCKARIEKAVNNMNGVANAAWDVKTKQLTVSFDSEITSLSNVEKAVTAVGHDTKNEKASTATYDNLPACCLYKRDLK